MKRKGFTLVELIISVTILGIIIFGTSTILFRVLTNYNNNQAEILVYNDIKEFLNDSYEFEYNSGIILSGSTKIDSLLLYNNNGGIIIGNFTNTGVTGEKILTNKNSTYGFGYYGFYKVNKSNLNNLISNNLLIENYKFNDGKIYKNLLINKINILSLNKGDIFDVKLSFFKKLNEKYLGLQFKDVPITNDDVVDFNFNF